MNNIVRRLIGYFENNFFTKQMDILKHNILIKKENNMWNQRLLEAEENAVIWKTGNTEYINQLLRTGAELTPEFFEPYQLEYLRFLDSAIEKSYIRKNTTLYRNVSRQKLIDGNGPFFPGSIIVDKGYMEASLVRLDLMLNFDADTLLILKVKKRVHVLYVPECNPGRADEYGVLFPRNTRIFITGIRRVFFSKYRWIIKGKIYAS